MFRDQTFCFDFFFLTKDFPLNRFYAKFSILENSKIWYNIWYLNNDLYYTHTLPIIILSTSTDFVNTEFFNAKNAFTTSKGVKFTVRTLHTNIRYNIELRSKEF